MHCIDSHGPSARLLTWLVGILCVTLAPAQGLARKPRLRLESVDASKCAETGKVQAQVVELELEGTLRPPPGEGYRVVVDGKPLPGAPALSEPFAKSGQPLLLSIVIQTGPSYSMDLPLIKKGVMALLKMLPPRAKVTVISFNWEVKRQINRATPQEAMKVLQDVGSGDPGSELALVDAIKMGLRGIASGESGARRMVVVISEGLNRSHKRDVFRSLGDRARKMGLPIHPIAFSPIDEREPLLNLGEIAKRSLGTLRWAQKPADLGEQFLNLGREINGQMALTFALPGGCRKEHKVSVRSGELQSNEVVVPAARVAARAGKEKSRLVLYLVLGGVILALVAGGIVVMLRRRRGTKASDGGPEMGKGKRLSDLKGEMAGIKPAVSEERVQETSSIQDTESIEDAEKTSMRKQFQGLPYLPVPENQPGRVENQPQRESARRGSGVPENQPGRGSNGVENQPGRGLKGQFFLMGASGAVQGQRYDLPQGKALVGTAPDCLIRLGPGLGVATYHVELTAGQGELLMEDLDSPQGVLVNGQPMKRAALVHGSVLQLGSIQLVVYCS